LSCLSWRVFIRKYLDLLSLPNLQFVESFWHFAFLISWASGVRCNRWMVTQLSIPKSSFTIFLMVFGSVLWCLSSCLMLCWGFSATAAWTEVMAASVRTHCFFLPLGHDIRP
jgi:hypothetical protein